MTYPEFEARWKVSGGAERANYVSFLQDLCDLIGAPRPDPTTDTPAQDAYVFERAVEFNDGAKRSTGRPFVGRIDLYKRGCFILETKQGTDSPDQQKKAELHELGLSPEKRRTGHAIRSSPKWGQMMQAARSVMQQAGQPLSAAQVASRFQRTKPDKVQPLLDTLATLSLLRLTPEETYTV